VSPARTAGWEHYDDLPYEVVVVGPDGEELVSRHSLRSEAIRQAIRRMASQAASLVNPDRYSVQVRDHRVYCPAGGAP
jgi:hypothetical protein